jgi:hypothetical protein
MYLHNADFYNVCEYPVNITIHEYTNIPASIDEVFELKPTNKTLGVGEKVSAFHFMTPHCSLEKKGLPSYYSFEISHNGNSRKIDNDQILKALKNKKRDGGVTTWTISDPSLCP